MEPVNKSIASGVSELPNTMTLRDAPQVTPSPYESVGAPGFVITGGFLIDGEKDPKLTGTRRYLTFSNFIANVAIVAASVRAFLLLVAKPEWTVEPADDSDEAQEKADFVTEALHDMATPFHQVVRRAALFRLHGFGLQEWTAKKRDDGQIGLADVEPRPQATVYRWDCDEHGNVIGVVQLAPQSQREVYIQREKLIYLVDDSLNDSPEGLGLLRHVALHCDRLQRFELLEAWGYETDIRGIPIARAPLRELAALEDKTAAAAQVAPMRTILESHNKNPALGVLLESEPFRSTGEQQTPSATRRFDFELLRGEAGPHAEVAASIERMNREIARVFGTEHLLLGADSKGSHAMASSKMDAFLTVINATILDLREQFRKDLLVPLWDLNGWDAALMPSFRTQPLGIDDITEVTAAILRMAQSGATLMPNDPAVNAVRKLLGLPDAPEMDLSLTPPLPGQGMLPGQAPPEPPPDPNAPPDDVKKYDDSEARDEGGKWTAGGDGGNLDTGGGKAPSASALAGAIEHLQATSGAGTEGNMIRAGVSKIDADMADVLGGNAFSDSPGILGDMAKEQGAHDVSDLFAEAPTETVKVSDLIAVQPAVERQSVIDMLRQNGGVPKGDQPVKVVRIGKKMYLVDGTHRTTAAYYLRQPRITAQVLDIPASALPKKGKK